MSKVLELQEEKGRIVNEMRSLSEKADNEKRSLTTEEDERYNKLDADLNAANKRIEREIKLENESRSLAEIEFAKKKEKGEGDNGQDNEKRFAKAFDNYLRRGFADLSKEDKAAMLEMRALSTTGGSGSEGGYTIPRGFSGELEKQMLYFGPMLQLPRQYNTSTGNTIDWPTINDTSNAGALIGENADHSDSVTDPAFGTKALKAYTFSSKLIRVPNELLQDSAFNLAGLIAELAGERLGRILNTYFTTGTGSSQPQGVVPGSSASGVTAAVSAITFDNLIDVIHSVDLAYRGRVAWMFNDTTAKALRKLKDGQGNYLWQMGDVRTGQPDSILGKPYYINNDMANIGASAKSVLCGDFSKFIVRRSQDFTTRRLDERYAEFNQTGFVVLGRYDSITIQSAAIKSLVHAAS